MQDAETFRILFFFMKYKLTLAYDGTNYGGWQVQLNTTSVQAILQDALSTALRTPTLATGSGRTDAGVHARGQVAHFEANSQVDTYRLCASLNGLLPHDIRVLSIEEVDDTFHARYSAKSKIYHYHLHVGPVLDPFKRLYSLHVPIKLDLDKMRQACALFVGERDFASYANEPHTDKPKLDTVRNMLRLDVIDEPGGVRLEYEANGFLYKMARTITGTLLEVGKNKLALEEIEGIFAAKDRRSAAMAAPPHGLFLVHVNY